MKQLKTCAEYSAGLTISQIGIRKNIWIETKKLKIKKEIL